MSANILSSHTVIVLGDMRDLHHHGCEAVMAGLLSGLAENGIPATTVLPGLSWQGHSDACLAADLVVINGEGALHHSRPAVSGILELAEKRRTAGRPTALVNTSWFENSDDLTARLAAFDLVSARDPQSAAGISAHAPEPLLVPDLAILHAIDHPSEVISNGKLMAGDSTTPDVTRRLRALAARRGWDYLPALARPVEMRPGKKSRKIHQRTRIALALGPLARWLMPARYHAHAVGTAETSAYLDSLAASSGVVTGRFHTVCFAIGLGVPFVALASNTPKIEALLADAGLDPGRRMIALDKLEDLLTIAPFSETELAALAGFRIRAIECRKMLFDRLRVLIG